MVEEKERTFGNFASTARLTSATLTALGCLSGKSTTTEGRVFAPLDARGVRVILTILSEFGECCDEKACRSDSRKEAGGGLKSQALMLTSADFNPSVGLTNSAWRTPYCPPFAFDPLQTDTFAMTDLNELRCNNLRSCVPASFVCVSSRSHRK